MFDADVISLAHGEGVRRPHPSVPGAGIAALLDVERSSIDNYLFLERLTHLDEALVDEFERLGVPVDTASALCINSGTTPICMSFLWATSQPGDIFLSPRSYYHPLASWCEITRVALGCIPTTREHDYKLTKEDLERWWSRADGDARRRLRGVLVFNPSMTGAVYSAEELADLAVFVERHDLLVLEDAIFSGTEFAGVEVARLAAVPGMCCRVVTVNGGSKAHGLANLRIGWGCGPRQIIARMQHHATATTATVPQVAQAMALAALRAPPGYAAQNTTECQHRARLIESLVSEVNDRLVQRAGAAAPQIVVEHRPHAGHSILLSVNGLAGMRWGDGQSIHDSIDVTRYLLADARVAVSPGLSLGFDRCEVRLSFGCVGAAATYAGTRDAELVAAVDTVAEYLPTGTTLRRGGRELASAGDERFQTPSGFAAGRRLIRDALLERIAPSLDRLTESNAGHLHAASRPVPGDPAPADPTRVEDRDQP